MFLTYATLSFDHTGLCVWKSVCPLCISNTTTFFFSLCVSFRAAQSVQSRHLRRVCVHSATSGYVTSAQMCISISEPLPLPSTQNCTHNRGPVPPSVLTCTREAPAPCLPLDKARYLHVLRDCYLHFPGQYDRLLVGLHSLSLYLSPESLFWFPFLPSGALFVC